MTKIRKRVKILSYTFNDLKKLKKGTRMSDQNDSKEIPSIAKMMFFGEVYEGDVFPYPQFKDEQKEITTEFISAFQRFAKDQINSEKMDEEAKIPDEVVQGLAEMGLFGLAVDEEYGGMGLTYNCYNRLFAEVGKVDASISTFLGAHQSIGYRALIQVGTKEQKQEWLPKLTSGEVVAAFCLTEPGSGSDAFSIKTKAKNNGNGTFTLNGQKLWITNAGLAKFYTVFCKTEHEKDGKIKEKISAFIVDGNTEGISVGEKENKMGIRASETRAIYFDNVIIPEKNILGEIGKGFKVAMNVLNTGRLSLGAGCAGVQQYALELATAHAKGRKQFGLALSEFGIIQEKLANMAANCYASESIVYMTTGKMEAGMNDYSMETGICKVFCSESMWETMDMALQIAGGNGYMREYPYERLMRDGRINLIFEGTNEILRCMLALTGMKDPADEMKKLGKAADISKALTDPIKSIGVLTNFARKRIRKMIAPKEFIKGHDKLGEETSNFNLMLNEFSTQVENTLMKYGKKIIQNELPQKRIADMLIHLYVTLCVISRTTTILESDSNDVTDDHKDYVVKLARIACKRSRYSFMSALKGMSKKADKEIIKLAKHVCEKDGYGLDILRF